jgi:adenylate kinase
MSLRLVVFGRQGAGKGTQCVRLAEHYGAPHISTGDMLREAVAEGTDFGRKAQEFMDAGQLLPDDIMLGIIEDRLNKPDVVERGFLLDGFPRTVGQARALIALTPIDRAVNIEVPEDLVLERMVARNRSDDTPEAIATRLEAYRTQTIPAVEHFDSLGLLTTVDGVGEMDEVTERLFAAIDASVASA